MPTMFGSTTNCCGDAPAKTSTKTNTNFLTAKYKREKGGKECITI